MSSFWIKIIAAAAMLADHAGMILFPDAIWLRIIGRLALPLYALCIAEGFRHTRNRKAYFLRIFALGAICQIVYIFVSEDLYLGILITFSISIVLLFFLDTLLCACRGEKDPLSSLGKKLFKKQPGKAASIALCAVLFAAALASAVSLTVFVRVDYGLSGILFPVLVYLGGNTRLGKFLGAAAGTAMLACNLEGSATPRIWSLLALIPLALYNGQPGKYKLKYFFYVFYPAHLVILYGIDLLIGLL
ncbi:MAG: hypothetical protein IJW70_12205 [Clostridia bacterium]|nr:hypothetical protein [Clostridia bacterium]MBQ7380428.1 hypothetical protein [Clostridia bacterium]